MLRSCSDKVCGFLHFFHFFFFISPPSIPFIWNLPRKPLKLLLGRLLRICTICFGKICFQSSDLFVFFIVPQRLTLVSIAKRNISKSNKSELWNCLSYRGLPYFFEVGSQTFRNDCKISRSQPQNSTSIVLWPQWPQKRHAQIFWK